MTAMAGATSRTQRERSDATISLLLTVAREIFGRDGYAATSLTVVVDVAGVTKGALYHHFKSKQDLFRAVYEAEGERLSQIVTGAYRDEPDQWEAFHKGVEAFLEALLDPWVQRIMLTDAPGALGMQAIWDNLTTSGFTAQIRRGLERAAEAGLISRAPTAATPHLIYGAVCSAAQLIARSDDQRAIFEDSAASLRIMLDALAGRTSG
ncbi:TetR/AcrR family transcriptional regulator [Actinoplanes sp. NPDC049118]|uniref:TetR/AcrR family transcriptional regulator n=1 Tax=Actinoplanes sp. NPDC049118 TaxID=3155769 RepID=UPI0034093369